MFANVVWKEIGVVTAILCPVEPLIRFSHYITLGNQWGTRLAEEGCFSWF